MPLICFPLQGGFVLDGVFYRDHQLKDIGLLLEPAGILPVGNMHYGHSSFQQDSGYNVNPGGRRNDSSGLLKYDHYAPWEPGGVILQLVKGSPKVGRWADEDTLELAAFDAVSKEEVYRWVIDRVPAKTIWRGRSGSEYSVFPTRANARSCLAVSGNTAYVLSEGFIYSFSLLEMGERTATLRIVPEQLQFNIESGSRPTKLNYTIVGGKPPYTSELRCLDVEPEISAGLISGSKTPSEFKLDGAELLSQFKKKSYETIVTNIRQIGTVETYNTDAGAYFEKLTGQKLKGVPFLVRMQLKVIDENKSEVELSHAIVIEVPLRELQFVLK